VYSGNYLIWKSMIIGKIHFLLTLLTTAILCVFLGGHASASTVAEWIALDLPDAGFEMAIGDSPWLMSQHAGVKAYRFERDAEQKTEGERSFKLVRHSPQVFASVQQAIRALTPGSYRFSADVKVAGGDRKGWALKATSRKLSGEFHVSESASLTGDTGWKRIDLEFQVTQDVALVSIGATLRGGGTAWMDNARLERRR
jgi:hypothetical protein